jgi:hypothetical protein
VVNTALCAGPHQAVTLRGAGMSVATISIVTTAYLAHFDPAGLPVREAPALVFSEAFWVTAGYAPLPVVVVGLVVRVFAQSSARFSAGSASSCLRRFRVSGEEPQRRSKSASFVYAFPNRWL